MKKIISEKNYLRAIVVVLTIGLLSFIAYRQYLSYHADAKITTQRLRVNTLKENIFHLDEALTMTARLYALTGNPEWRNRYRKHESEYNASLNEINILLTDTFQGKKELDGAGQKLFAMEANALDLVQLYKPTQARAILFSQAYSQNKQLYNSGLVKLATSLQASDKAFELFQRKAAIKNLALLAAVVLLILVGWFAFLTVSTKWQRILNNMHQDRAEEAIKTETVLREANNQLQFLSAHIQELREKERLAIADHINEELGQQITAARIKIGMVRENLTANHLPQAETLHDTYEQLGASLNFLKQIAVEVYPGVLRDLGLVEALDWESNRLAKQSGLVIVFSSELDELHLDPNTAITLFRTYQEKVKILIRNGATEVVGSLRSEDDHLVLTIMDNSPNLPGTRKEIQIEDLVIEERLRSISGYSGYTSSPEEGNIFTSYVPNCKSEQVSIHVYKSL